MIWHPKTPIEIPPIEFDGAEVIRLLGYKRQGNAPPLRTIKTMEQMAMEARKLIKPRGIYDLQQVDSAKLPEGVPRCNQLGVGICTLGSALEEEVQARIASNCMVEAVILDAFGSHAAECTADHLNHHICGYVRELGLYAAPRISPGYGRFRIHSQQWLFGLLDGTSIGVHLLPTMLMKPVKSISFVITCHTTPINRSSKKCRHCTLRTCQYRDEDEQGRYDEV